MPKLGVDNGYLAPCPDRPNCVNSQAVDTAHCIEPILVSASPAASRNALVQLLHEYENARLVVEEERYFRAEFVTKVFRFVDDVEFYFPDDHEETLRIHVRSAARVGYFDFGVNRRRIEEIRKRLATILGKGNEG